MTVGDVHLKQVASCQIPGEWASISYLLELGREYWDSYYTLEQIHELLLEGTFQFWYLRDENKDLPYLGGMTQVDVYGRKKVLRILWIGGTHLGEIMTLLWVVENWAKKNDIEEVEVYGRDAFIRMLHNAGYRKTHVVLMKKLNEKEN